jgi:hypothetical protein
VARISTPATAIPILGLVRPASTPHKAVSAATVRLLVTDQADRVRATRSFCGLLEPVGGEYRIEHANAGDEAELDDDDQQDSGDAGADEGQPDRGRRWRRCPRRTAGS